MDVRIVATLIRAILINAIHPNMVFQRVDSLPRRSKSSINRPIHQPANKIKGMAMCVESHGIFSPANDNAIRIKAAHQRRNKTNARCAVGTDLRKNKRVVAARIPPIKGRYSYKGKTIK